MAKITNLKTRADNSFSRYIRLRDAEDNSQSFYVKCCTCGKVFHWKDVDAGHYIRRGRNTLRYNEKNAHAQCRPCNRGGNRSIAYTKFMLDRYGRDVLDELESLEHTNHKFDADELLEIIKRYKDMAKSVEKRL